MKKSFFLVASLLLLFSSILKTQEAAISPPDTLVVDGVPPIPVSLAQTAARYTAYRGANIVDWHPTQLNMLISTRFAETPQLHLVAHPEGERRQLTFFVDAVRNGRFHPNGADYIVFSKDIGGGEWYQLYRYDIASGNITLLSDGKSRNLLGPWSSKGDHIAYMSTRRTGKDTDLWVMNPADPKSDHLLTQLTGGGWAPVDWSPDDSKILLLEELSINESYFWLVDAKTGEKTAVTPRDVKEKISYGEGQFSKNGKGIYVTTDKDWEFHRLAYLNLATKEYTYCTTSIPWDVQEFDLSKDDKRIAFLVNEDGVDTIHLLDTASRKITNPRHPTGVIGGLRWHRNNKDVGFTLTDARITGDSFSLNADTGKITRWTHSESAVPTDNFPAAQLVKWKSFDGKSITGFMYRPPAEFTGKRPVLVVIHGGPEGQSQPTFLGRNNYLLNELGIVLIYPNVRGSMGYGKTFTLLDNGFQREDTYKDINALVDWIGTQPDLDSDRIAVTGGSYGGHMTLAVSTFYSDRIRCSVDIVGMSNLVTFLEHTEAYRRDLRRVEYGDERDPKMHDFLEKIAPMNNIEKIKKPMMVVAGRNDPRVPVSESDQIVAALKQQGTPVWYVMAKDEGHGFQKKANQDYQFYATIEFLKEFLLK
jgi:dipeptidyl aminopeptidase/acylaminoacyl peptidase